MPAPALACLLRGINVSGRRMVKMDKLRASCEARGLEEVRTYVQSGNIVFRSAKKPEALAALFVRLLAEDFQLDDVPVTILTARELAATLEENPFLKEKGIDPATLHVTFLSAAPAATVWKKLEAVHAGTDRFRAAGKRVYLHCPVSYGNTKLSNATLERLLAVTATTRNWKTVTELARMTA
jgi:uncharacterized protein (DUF1697 family)